MTIIVDRREVRCPKDSYYSVPFLLLVDPSASRGRSLRLSGSVRANGRSELFLERREDQFVLPDDLAMFDIPTTPGLPMNH